MKKLVVLSAAFAVLKVSVFAEVSVTGEFDAVLMPLQVIHGKGGPRGDETIVGAGLGRNGNGDAARARIGIKASDENEKIGLEVKLQFNNNNGFRVAFDDFAEVWVKPIDWLRFDVGRFNNDTLRGKIGDDGWSHYTVTMKTKDEIFTRFQGQSFAAPNVHNSGGFLISAAPIEGLFIGAGVPGLISFQNSGTNPDWVQNRAAYAYQHIQVGVGYEINGVGLARAQYVGAKPAVQDFTTVTPAINAPRFEIAFAFTGMEGLVLDLGAKIPFAFSEFNTGWGLEKKEDISVIVVDYATWQAPFQISLGAGFATGPIDIQARADAKFAGTVKPDSGGSASEIRLPFILNVHLWPSYNLGFATVGVDLGLDFIGKETNGNGDVLYANTSSEMNGGVRVGFGAWLKKSFGASSIKGGLAYRVAGEVNSKKEPGVFSIPIMFEYSF
jgi:hypothetical protein